jgi:hypothetical protein
VLFINDLCGNQIPLIGVRQQVGIHQLCGRKIALARRRLEGPKGFQNFDVSLRIALQAKFRVQPTYV